MFWGAPGVDTADIARTRHRPTLCTIDAVGRDCTLAAGAAGDSEEVASATRSTPSRAAMMFSSNNRRVPAFFDNAVRPIEGADDP